jgi:hypothetical protein
MAINYTYTVDKTWVNPEPVNGFSQVVLDVHMTVTATDDVSGETATQKINANLPMPEEGSNFTEFSSLTEAQVIQFAKDALGQGAISTLEEVLTSQLASAQPGLPWA